MSEIEAFVILNSIPHLGATKIRLLLQQFGTAVDALNASSADINALPGFERVTPYWNLWRKDKMWQQDLQLVAQHNVQLIPFTSPHYPKSLLEIADHPTLLYVRGELKSQDQRSLAVIGTRNASIYGMEFAASISTTLAANGFTVISGLARGIDTAAHQGALAGGRTIGVIGSGLARIYPTENQMLADKISQHGALISEFAMTTPPDRQNFPQRNRIVSGLSMGVILIEAPLKSGAMITMDKAHQHKRQLFALPGRADHDNFRGNHLLIKNGKAQLIENAEDVMIHYQELFPFVQSQAFNTQYPALDREENSLLENMSLAEISIDELSIKASLPVQQVQRILMSLLLKKVIKEFPGKIYKKVAAGNKPNRHN